MVSGLSYCHSLHIVHQDISTNNILISKEGLFKFIDFGILKQVKHTFQSIDDIANLKLI
jgi:serine/threonine protein kinase